MKKTIEETKEWLLENRTDKNGNLDLSGLDFSDFDGNVDISEMKVKRYLFQDNQKVGKTLFQHNQKVEGNLYQENQQVKGGLFQDTVKTYTKNELEEILGHKIIIKEE